MIRTLMEAVVVTGVMFVEVYFLLRKVYVLVVIALAIEPVVMSPTTETTVAIATIATVATPADKFTISLVRICATVELAAITRTVMEAVAVTVLVLVEVYFLLRKVHVLVVVALAIEPVVMSPTTETTIAIATIATVATPADKFTISLFRICATVELAAITRTIMEAVAVTVLVLVELYLLLRKVHVLVVAARAIEPIVMSENTEVAISLLFNRTGGHLCPFRNTLNGTSNCARSEEKEGNNGSCAETHGEQTQKFLRKVRGK